MVDTVEVREISVSGEPTMLVDGGDLGCARLLVRLRDVVRTLAPGALVHLDTTDPIAPIDLPAWCRLTGHTYVGRVAEPVPTPRLPTARRYALRVAPDARATAPGSPWRLDTDDPAAAE